MEQERVINVAQITKEVTNKIIASWKEPEERPDPPLAILLAGFQGSGKSTIANGLQHGFGFTVVSLDDVRNFLFEDYGFQRPVPEEFIEIVNKARDKLVGEAVRRNLSFVLDTNMTPQRIDYILKSFPKIRKRYKVVSVFLEAPGEELERRVLGRPSKPGGYGGVDELYGSMKQHGKIDMEKYNLIINTASLNKEQAVQKIKEFVESLKVTTQKSKASKNYLQ